MQGAVTDRSEDDEKIIQGDFVASFLGQLGIYAQAGGHYLKRYRDDVTSRDCGDPGPLTETHVDDTVGCCTVLAMKHSR